MIAGLSAAERELIAHEVIQPLQAAGLRVWCFGSRARGDASRYADIDLLIGAANEEQPLDERAVRQLLGVIDERLVESNFPYKVDLVLENDLAHAYRESVEGERIELLVPATSIPNPG